LNPSSSSSLPMTTNRPSAGFGLTISSPTPSHNNQKPFRAFIRAFHQQKFSSRRPSIPSNLSSRARKRQPIYHLRRQPNAKKQCPQTTQPRWRLLRQPKVSVDSETFHPYGAEFCCWSLQLVGLSYWIALHCLCFCM
jgi:hypothetical protein